MALCAALLLVACIPPARQRWFDRLNGEVSLLTYDDALQQYGQPSAVIQGDEVLVVTWHRESTGAMAMDIGNMTYAAPVSHGWTLQMTFGKQSRRMRNWHYEDW